MNKSRLLGAVCALWMLVPVTSLAATVNLVATIDGLQANAGAGTGSTGTGSATMTFDDITNLFSWDISWSGLTGTETNAHFHGPATPSQNAGVQVPIDYTSNPSIGFATISGTQAGDLLAGLWYINIHTVTNLGGEIRGQVQVVPIPAALYLFGSGLLGLVGMARRKKAA